MKTKAPKKKFGRDKERFHARVPTSTQADIPAPRPSPQEQGAALEARFAAWLAEDEARFAAMTPEERAADAALWDDIHRNLRCNRLALPVPDVSGHE